MKEILVTLDDEIAAYLKDEATRRGVSEAEILTGWAREHCRGGVERPEHRGESKRVGLDSEPTFPLAGLVGLFGPGQPTDLSVNHDAYAAKQHQS